ncbi:hypothetical protein GGR58DRAFT_493 [Xylaria digitata]|nr:hypothetical protein GGR58DRAFT_493 [Xylaria digitata]
MLCSLHDYSQLYNLGLRALGLVLALVLTLAYHATCRLGAVTNRDTLRVHPLGIIKTGTGRGQDRDEDEGENDKQGTYYMH